MFATVNGISLAYSDTREGHPVVLLVHGFPFNRAMWDPQFGSLRARARVIAPDLRGFGASEAGPPGPLTMEQHADDLAALLDAIGVTEPVVFCGLSMGGYVGFQFWRRHRHCVRAFVFADTRAAADSAEARAGRLAMAERVESSGSVHAAVETMLPRLFAPGLRLDSPVPRQVEAMMASTSPRAIADGQRGMAQRSDSRELLPGITVPTLVIVGEQDVISPGVPREMEAMAAAMPRAVFVQVPNAGHVSNLENPDWFNQALLAFLDSLSVQRDRRR